MCKKLVSSLLLLILCSCSSGGDDLTMFLPTLSITCKSSDINTCTSSNSSRYAIMGLKPRFDGYTCKQIYDLYPTNYNDYFEYHISIQVFTNSSGLFAQGFDWLDKNSNSVNQAEPDTEYTLCGFIDFNSDLRLSSDEPFYTENFNFNFNPYDVDEWVKYQ